MTLYLRTVDTHANMIIRLKVIPAVVLAILRDITNHATVKSLADVLMRGQFKTVIIDLVQLAC